MAAKATQTRDDRELTARNDALITKRFTQAQDRLVLQAADLSLETISNMVERKAIDVAPSFQRRERWSPQKQSALIESFLLNVPVPPVYLMEDDYGTYSVIDGKQRIVAINAFISGRLQLAGLRSFPEVQGLRFKNLPRAPRNALEVRPYLRVITLLRQSDPELKYEVFTRLNEGGEPLNPQELRNVVFRGPMNDLVYELAETPFLRLQLKIRNTKSPAYQVMDDAEYVLRFFMLCEEWKAFSGDYRLSMDRFMQSNRQPSQEAIDMRRREFQRAISAASRIWGDAAFKRPSGAGWRDQMLAGMYDAQMIAVKELADADLEKAATSTEAVRRATRELFDLAEFEEAVRRATNTPSRVKYRIERVMQIISNV